MNIKFYIICSRITEIPASLGKLYSINEREIPTDFKKKREAGFHYSDTFELKWNWSYKTRKKHC